MLHPAVFLVQYLTSVFAVTTSHTLTRTSHSVVVHVNNPSCLQRFRSLTHIYGKRNRLHVGACSFMLTCCELVLPVSSFPKRKTIFGVRPFLEEFVFCPTHAYVQMVHHDMSVYLLVCITLALRSQYFEPQHVH